MFCLLLRFFNTFSTFWNAFQNHFKLVLKSLYCIYGRYVHFITPSWCKRHTNTNNIKQELLAYYKHKCIFVFYEHFITHSQCQSHTNTNNIKQELLAHYKHINEYLFFIYFPDVVNRNRVIGRNQIKWNYVKKSKPGTYGKILQPDGNKDAANPRNWVHGQNQNMWNMNRCNLGYK